MYLDNPIFDYTCLLAEVPNELSKLLADWSFSNICQDVVFEDESEFGFGREYYFHVTMISSVLENNEKIISESISREKPCDCIMGQIGFFRTNSKFDVIFVEVINEKLNKLQKNLECSIKNKLIFDHFIPHITLAYLKKGSNIAIEDKNYFNQMSFNITELVLSDRLGSKKKFKLGCDL